MANSGALRLRAGDPERERGSRSEAKSLNGYLPTGQFWPERCPSSCLADGKVRENLFVMRDGLANNALGRGWPQMVEELIPLEISQLFFFDGEKIRTLAEDETTSAALGAVIKAILGLDIVERLIADATVLQARMTKDAGPPEQRALVEGLEQEPQRLQTEVDNAQGERASLENHRLRAESAMHEAEAAFASAGEKHWEERQDRAQRLGEVGRKSGELEGELRGLAAGELPLALVLDLLGETSRQASQEREAAETETVHRLLEGRDEQFLAALRERGAAAALVRFAAEFLSEDRHGCRRRLFAGWTCRWKRTLDCRFS